MVRELHARRATGSGRPVDEDTLSLVDARAPEAGQALICPVTHGGGVLECHLRRDLCDKASASRTQRYSACGAAPHAKHAVAHMEVRDGGSHGLDIAGELEAKDLRFGLRSPSMNRQRSGRALRMWQSV